MFSKSTIDDSTIMNDTSRVIRMMIISDATTWSIAYDHNWWQKLRLRLGLIKMSIVQASLMIVTYDRQNIFIVQATGKVDVFTMTPLLWCIPWQCWDFSGFVGAGAAERWTTRSRPRRCCSRRRRTWTPWRGIDAKLCFSASLTQRQKYARFCPW